MTDEEHMKAEIEHFCHQEDIDREFVNAIGNEATMRGITDIRTILGLAKRLNSHFSELRYVKENFDRLVNTNEDNVRESCLEEIRYLRSSLGDTTKRMKQMEHLLVKHNIVIPGLNKSNQKMVETAEALLSEDLMTGKGTLMCYEPVTDSLTKKIKWTRVPSEDIKVEDIKKATNDN